MNVYRLHPFKEVSTNYNVNVSLRTQSSDVMASDVSGIQLVKGLDQQVITLSS